MYRGQRKGALGTNGLNRGATLVSLSFSKMIFKVEAHVTATMSLFLQKAILKRAILCSLGPKTLLKMKILRSPQTYIFSQIFYHFHSSLYYHENREDCGTSIRSSHAKVLLGKGIMKICSIITGEHPCRSAISIKLLCHTSTQVFSCKFAAYFQNTFSHEHFWVAASEAQHFSNQKQFCSIFKIFSLPLKA